MSSPLLIWVQSAISSRLPGAVMNNLFWEYLSTTYNLCKPGYTPGAYGGWVDEKAVERIAFCKKLIKRASLPVEIL